MTITEIQEIRRLIGRAKLKEAIQKLLDANTEYNDAVLGLQSQLSSLVDKELIHIIDSDKARIERNSISHSLLKIVSGLEEKLDPEDIQNARNYSVPDTDGLEKIIDKNGLRPIDWYHKVSQNSRSVCKIHASDGYVGTGFLIEGGYIFTNNHVLRAASIAQFSKIEFGYDNADADSVFFELDHKDFITSEELDYTRVKVKTDNNGNSLSDWGTLKLSGNVPNNTEDLVIIQHPKGRVKEIAHSEGTHNSVWEHRIHYKVTTEPGSSGSPVFDINWNVVALHHAGGNLQVNANGEVKYTNEGILFNYILQDLTSRKTNTSDGHERVTVEPDDVCNITKPVKTLLVYNKEDDHYAKELDKHLFSAKRRKDIALFDIHKNVPVDANREEFLQDQLDIASIVLVLISNSLYLEDTIEIALKVEDLVEEKRVIPIRISPFDLEGTSFEPLQGLPRGKFSLSESKSLDAENVEITKALKSIVDNLVCKNT